jgi:hypothetical protein
MIVMKDKTYRFGALRAPLLFEEATVINALLLLVAAATPCESLTILRFADATITAAAVVPEGPRIPRALRVGYATAGTDTGHQEPGGDRAIGHD